MVDEEVETILAEIRERVRGRESNSAPAVFETDSVNAPTPASLAPPDFGNSPADEILARIDSYLTVTSRAWDRLPPIVSNRSGGVARIELWVKRQIKRVTHWFTWEQVNFNAAAHHALVETLQALAAYQKALEQARAEHEVLREDAARQRASLEENRNLLNSLLKDLQAERARFNAYRSEMETQRAAQVARQRKDMEAQLAAIASELRERVGQVQDEQRVCFKQLSLAATEAAVLEDRARRQTELLIEGLKQRLAKFEN